MFGGLTSCLRGIQIGNTNRNKILNIIPETLEQEFVLH